MSCRAKHGVWDFSQWVYKRCNCCSNTVWSRIFLENSWFCWFVFNSNMRTTVLVFWTATLTNFNMPGALIRPWIFCWPTNWWGKNCEFFVWNVSLWKMSWKKLAHSLGAKMISNWWKEKEESFVLVLEFFKFLYRMN